MPKKNVTRKVQESTRTKFLNELTQSGHSAHATIVDMLLTDNLAGAIQALNKLNKSYQDKAEKDQNKA